MIAAMDLGWVAGFIEGEGSFYAQRKKRGTMIIVAAPQVQREPLERLQILLGGQIYRRANGIYVWNLTKAALCAGLMMTLFPLMSPKRQEQIRRALATWRSVPSTLHECRRGHPRTPENTSTHSPRHCLACRRVGSY